MSLSHPSLRVPDLESNGKVQLFLERAEELIFSNPSLTAERWRELAVLAAEIELSVEQFRSTIDDLVGRGVLQRTDAMPPMPPPLPPRAVTPKRSELVQEIGFALSPPPDDDVP